MHAQPAPRPGQTALGCVIVSVVVLLVAAACVAVTSTGNDSDTDTTPPPAEPESDTEFSDEDITTLALDLTWNDMSETERDDLCWEVQVLGSERAAVELMEGAGPDSDLDEPTVADWLDDTCL